MDQNETYILDGYNLNITCPTNEMPISNAVFMGIYALICIIGLLGNTLVIYVVLRFSNMQTVTNMYILNLAIADECFLIGIPFLITTMYMGDWIFGAVLCKAYMVSTSITQFTSSIFLLILSADRYIAICHHVLSPKYRSPIVSKLVSAFAWIISVLIMLPIIMYANVMEKRNGGFTCNVLWPESHGQLPGFTFTIYSFVLGFAVPLCFVMIFYFLVVKKLREMSKNSNSIKKKGRTHKRVSILVYTLITVYIICWLPYWISQVVLISSPYHLLQTNMEMIKHLLIGCFAYLNSAINPILYACLNKNFKCSFIKACSTCARSKNANLQFRYETTVIPNIGENKMIESQLMITTGSRNMLEPITSVTGHSDAEVCKFVNSKC